MRFAFRPAAVQAEPAPLHVLGGPHTGPTPPGLDCPDGGGQGVSSLNAPDQSCMPDGYTGDLLLIHTECVNNQLIRTTRALTVVNGQILDVGSSIGA